MQLQALMHFPVAIYPIAADVVVAIRLNASRRCRNCCGAPEALFQTANWHFLLHALAYRISSSAQWRPAFDHQPDAVDCHSNQQACTGGRGDVGWPMHAQDQSRQRHQADPSR